MVKAPSEVGVVPLTREERKKADEIEKIIDSGLEGEARGSRRYYFYLESGSIKLEWAEERKIEKYLNHIYIEVGWGAVALMIANNSKPAVELML